MGTTEVGITVGMPVRNAMPWLPEAMESLLRQTTTAFEMLVIAGPSTDGSTGYLRSLRDSRLRVVEQAHAGLTAALNQLLEETRTPWMARMDADDVSYPMRMERLQAEIQAHPDAGLIYSLADYHPRERCAGQFRCSRGTPEELRSIVEQGYQIDTSALLAARAKSENSVDRMVENDLRSFGEVPREVVGAGIGSLESETGA